jgi:putative oxidoreductase
MKKLLSTNYTDASFNIATFLLRVGSGALIFLNHGLAKFNKFSEMQNVFFDPFHIGHRFSLILTLFAELICSLLLVLGLLTRLAAFVLVINMSVAVFLFHFHNNSQPIAEFEIAVLYLVAFFSILLVGPGKISVDRMIGK